MRKSRYIYPVTFMLSCLLMAVMNITIAETIDKGEIKFKRGSSSGTVSGAVIRGERNQYSLMAGSGQWMEVKIKSPEDNAVFQVSVYSYGTGEDVQLDGAKDGDDAKYWYGRLPKPGYSKNGKQNAVDIVVGGTRGNASYDLTVTITNRKAQTSEKVTIGTITSMEEGDRGCYVDFTDDSGKEHSELAEFEICEQREFINKKVKLSYTEVKVMAAECGGDPECKQSDTVWLINGMK